MELVATVVVFGACMAGLGIGVILRGRSVRGSCGAADAAEAAGHDLSCAACPRKEAAICPTDEPLVRGLRL